MTLTVFSVAWAALLYVFNSGLARKLKRIDLRKALVYISSVAFIGVYGEVFINSVYTLLVGSPLWEYRVLPIHQAYTSLYSIVIWGIYGFHLYLLHDTIDDHRLATPRNLSTVFAIEAIILEILFNVSYLAIFGGYIFYYFPNDLWHLTSIQALPFYFLGGMVIVKTLKRFKTDPKFFIAMSIVLTVVLVFLVS